MHVYESLPELIGNTPILELKRSGSVWKTCAPIYAKLEYFNPLGSIKDRAALYMIDEAQKSGKIREGTVVIEPTSGNTGIGLAYICATRGIRLVLTMPENMSKERRSLLAALGAEIVLTPAWEGMNGAVNSSSIRRTPTPSSPTSSATPPMCRPMWRPPRRRFSGISTIRWTFSSPPWAPAAPSPATPRSFGR